MEPSRQFSSTPELINEPLNERVEGERAREREREIEREKQKHISPQHQTQSMRVVGGIDAGKAERKKGSFLT